MPRLPLHQRIKKATLWVAFLLSDKRGSLMER